MYNIAQYNIAQYNIAQYNIAQYNIAQYNIALYMYSPHLLPKSPDGLQLQVPQPPFPVKGFLGLLQLQLKCSAEKGIYLDNTRDVYLYIYLS